MKRVFLTLFLLATNAYAVGFRVGDSINAASATIPTAASAVDTGSLMATLTRAVESISCYNGTSVRVSVNVEDGTSASAPTEADYTMAAGTGVTFDKNIGAAIYIWSASGSTISSGVVDCTIKYKQ